MEAYLYGSYAVALIAIIGYQVFVQARIKSLSAKVDVMHGHGPRGGSTP